MTDYNDDDEKPDSEKTYDEIWREELHKLIPMRSMFSPGWMPTTPEEDLEAHRQRHEKAHAAARKRMEKRDDTK